MRLVKSSHEVLHFIVPESLVAGTYLVEDFNNDGLVDLYVNNWGRDDAVLAGEHDFFFLANENGLWVDAYASNIRARPCTRITPAFSG